MNISSLSDLIISRAQGATRHLVAIAGPPGAGKSTLAEDLCRSIEQTGTQCALVPMDGFHLNNNILEGIGLLDRKGSPDTFDAQGFVQLVKRLATGEHNVYVPVFDRDRDIAVAGAACVEPSCKIVLVEGNYLFLNRDNWSALTPYWQTGVFINPGMDIINTRLKQRWLDQGLSLAESQNRVNANDLPNAKTVLTESNTGLADVIIEEVWEKLA